MKLPILTLVATLVVGICFSTTTYADDSARGFLIEEANRATSSTKQRASNSGNLIVKSKQYLGANARQLGLPTSQWCADFMNMLVGGKDRRAYSYLNRGAPAKHGCINCVAVTRRKGGGHVGVVTGYDSRGNPIIISGNHSRRVGIGVYARHAVVSYRYV